MLPCQAQVISDQAPGERGILRDFRGDEGPESLPDCQLGPDSSSGSSAGAEVAWLESSCLGLPRPQALPERAAVLICV